MILVPIGAVRDHLVSCPAEEAGSTGHRSGPTRTSLIGSQCHWALRWSTEEGSFFASICRGIVLRTSHAGRRYRRRVRCLGMRYSFISAPGTLTLNYLTQLNKYSVVPNHFLLVTKGKRVDNAGERSEAHCTYLTNRIRATNYSADS